MQTYKILIKGGQGEIIEKKSRFIASLQPVASEEEAAAFIEAVKKKYWDAKHNCTAMVLGRNAEITRCSDDGEPSGTAGRPMLEVLTGEGLRDVVVVVTRYFGGTLLGTGGLVRAYSQAVKEGLKNCETGVLREGRKVKLLMSYNDYGKVEHLCRMEGQELEEVIYREHVTVLMTIPEQLYENRLGKLRDASAGRLEIEELGKCTFLDKGDDDAL